MLIVASLYYHDLLSNARGSIGAVEAFSKASMQNSAKADGFS